jgi:hypothetical protein
MPFGIHQDKKFVEVYHDRPFQGQDPKKAKIVFLGSDANYSPKISNDPFFDYILEYQRNGVAFWQNKKYACHHPFLLPNFPFDKRKDGVPFHRNFSKLGNFGKFKLKPEKYAAYISFLELLDVPTTGNKSEDIKEFDKLLSLKHLLYIDELIKGGGQKLFYVSNGVLKDIKRIKNIYPCNDLFDWVQQFVVGSQNRFTVRRNGNEIKEIYHFSSFEIHSHLLKIKSEMDQWLGY